MSILKTKSISSAKIHQFLADFNVFAAYVQFIFLIASIPILAMYNIGIWMEWFDEIIGGWIYIGLCILLCATVPLYRWWRSGLSPAVRHPSHERRYRLGHILIAGALCQHAVMWALWIYQSEWLSVLLGGGLGGVLADGSVWIINIQILSLFAMGLGLVLVRRSGSTADELALGIPAGQNEHINGL